MATTAITTDYYLPTTSSKTTGNSNLGKDEFLKILMTQLQNQDPTSPMDDKEFIAQMAQFSSLEQMSNMATSLDNLTAMTQQSQLVQFNSFVGKTVTWHEAGETLDENGNPVMNTGTDKITSVRYNGTDAQFVLANGKVISAANVSEVSEGTATSNPNSLVEASMLIGKKVQYTDADNNEMNDTVTSVSKKDGTIQYKLSNGTSITADQMTAISA
ncbi:MAG: flagellar hook assembly protein FlgD [Kurthia sp.]|nr:flagellar hook assembly protein FlgD [Candidatus Kurthia equi]